MQDVSASPYAKQEKDWLEIVNKTVMYKKTGLVKLIEKLFVLNETEFSFIKHVFCYTAFVFDKIPNLFYVLNCTLHFISLCESTYGQLSQIFVDSLNSSTSSNCYISHIKFGKI